MHRKKIAFTAAIVTTIVLVLGATTASASSAVLQKESQGNEVTALQKDLIKLGYLDSDPTGYYGDLTVEAIKKVQKEYGYVSDGVAGEITLSLVDRLLGRNIQSKGSSNLMQEGDENSSVKSLQRDLIKLGYLDTDATGFYGPATKAAVIKLQKKNGYDADGITGTATLKLIDKLVNVKSTPTKTVTATAAVIKKEPAPVEKTVVADNTPKTAAKEETAAVTVSTVAVASEAVITTDGAANPENVDTTTTDGAVESDPVKKTPVVQEEKKTEKKDKLSDYLLKWFNNVENIFDRGDAATVYDIKTGKSFKIKRTYGTNHADCETVSKKDTAIMKEIFGGNWNWERREVIVLVDGRKIAGSMTGYPHAGSDKYAANKTISSRSGGYGRGTNFDSVKSNSMNGHFDIHFLGSRNHYNNKIDPKHQDVVKKAAKWALENY